MLIQFVCLALECVLSLASSQAHWYTHRDDTVDFFASYTLGYFWCVNFTGFNRFITIYRYDIVLLHTLLRPGWAWDAFIHHVIGSAFLTLCFLSVRASHIIIGTFI